MAKFEIGDKVKFVNQVGGGIVTKVTDDFVFVADETGFDLPMQPTELIRMADMKGTGKMFNDTALERKEAPMPQLRPVVKALQPTPEEEIRTLRSQVASLKDQVSKLKKQLSNVQRQNSKQFADNVLLQHEVTPGEAEVDLHIDMLCEEPAKLAPHEAFEMQMRYFRTCMNHAVMNHYKKVTFIHGVGRGVLRDEILAELKKYDSIHFFDAPMQKYGVGAVEVYFGNNAQLK